MSNDEVYHAFCTYLCDSGIADVLAGAAGVACAFSGGADSTLLLILLEKYCRTASLSLQAVHVHHGIRGAEADRDAAFCAQFCEKRNIQFSLCRVDVPRYAALHKCGIEEAARILRYRALEGAVPVDFCIATAHNATDQVETVLFHLCRGSGLHGLCGIAPVRDRLIRPLLFLSSDAIRVLCHKESIPYVIDETNADTTYTRNYIRAEIVPRLSVLNPALDTAVFHMTSLLREDECILDSETERIVAEKPNRQRFIELPVGIRSRVLRRMYADICANGDLTMRHIRAMTAALLSEQPHTMIDLPGGIRFYVDRDTVRFEKSDRHHKTDKEKIEEKRYPVGSGIWENDRYLLTLTNLSSLSQKKEEKSQDVSENIYKISMQEQIDFAKIKGVLCVRTRIAGDTIRYGGLTRRVKTLLSDRKLPLAVRDALPVVTDDAGIVWLPGFPLRDGMAPCAESGEICLLRLYEKHLDT